MKKLDLNGLPHDDVWDIVENFILVNSDELPLRIITGNSDRMKEIVQGVLDTYDYVYETSENNVGEIIVIHDKDKMFD